MSSRSLFHDMFQPVDPNRLYENGLILQECFCLIKEYVRSGQAVLKITEMVEEILQDTEECISTVSRETRPHQDSRESLYFEEGYLYTIDIAFKLHSTWIDGAVTFPCGRLNKEKQSFWNSITQQHIKMLKSFHPPVSFKDWIKIAGLDLSSVLPGMGGHGIGQDLHEEPELIYSDPGDILLTRDSVFTHEPVFFSNNREGSCIAYHESSLFYHQNKLCYFPDIKKIFFFDQPC